MTYTRSYAPCSIASSCGYCSSCLESTVGKEQLKKDYDYFRIKEGVKKSVPAALVLWPFHKMPSKQGLTSRKVITFLREHYYLPKSSRNSGRRMGALLRSAVEFGLLAKRGNKYFLRNNK
ncbi:hypothetical protein K1T71_008179 [Dendrolimus kikuchii]|uniref:Uncharacterized protein n=1 Tax=Dendrolimus kikuchii TaxID=765133 RepID=A0ACC1CWR7_9NEOP|nr:hypothetical protein K1T71_008179 [Dendrolimus kikuchii]